MASKRYSRAHQGSDEDDKSLEGYNLDTITPLERYMVRSQAKKPKAAVKPKVTKGAEPRQDKGASDVPANYYNHEAAKFKVWKETPGGRAGTKGRRKNETLPEA